MSREDEREDDVRFDFVKTMTPVTDQVRSSVGIRRPAGKLAVEGRLHGGGAAFGMPAVGRKLPIEGAAAGLVEAFGVTVEVGREAGLDKIVVGARGPEVEVLEGGSGDMVFDKH